MRRWIWEPVVLVSTVTCTGAPGALGCAHDFLEALIRPLGLVDAQHAEHLAQVLHCLRGLFADQLGLASPCGGIEFLTARRQKARMDGDGAEPV